MDISWIKRHYLFFVLIAPLYYIVDAAFLWGFQFGFYYFFVVTSIGLFLVPIELSKEKFINYLKTYWLPLGLFFFLFLSFLLGGHYDVHHSKPLAFFAVFLLALHVFNTLEIDQKTVKKNVLMSGVLLLGVSVFLVFKEANYHLAYWGLPLSRFQGFSLSPTTFAVYLTAIYLLFSKFIHTRKSHFLVFFLVLVLIFLSKTRLNLLFFLLLPLFAIPFVKKHPAPIFWGTIVFLSCAFMLIPPLMDYSHWFSMGRFSQIDISSYNRLTIFNHLLKTVQEASFLQHLFGHGMEFARYKMTELHNPLFTKDFFPHHDFIRLYIDYGLLFFVGFFFLLYKEFGKQPLSLVLVLLFFISFFHNMVFDGIIVLYLLSAKLIGRITSQ